MTRIILTTSNNEVEISLIQDGTTHYVTYKGPQHETSHRFDELDGLKGALRLYTKMVEILAVGELPDHMMADIVMRNVYEVEA